MEAWILAKSRSKDELRLPLYPWIPRGDDSIVFQSGIPYYYQDGRWQRQPQMEEGSGKEKLWRQMEHIHIIGGKMTRRELPSDIPVHQHLDRLPTTKPDWDAITSISVPSHDLEEQLRSLVPANISLRVVLPTVPQVSHRWEPAGRILRRLLRERWGLQGKRVLGIVLGTITRLEWAGCREVVKELRRQGLKRLVLHLFSPKTAEGEEAGRSWVAADWLLSGGGKEISRTPLHFWAMARGMPLLTTDVGDHGEWVRHRHNGLLLTSSYWKRELFRYLLELSRDPDWCEDLGQNGRQLVSKWKNNP